MMRLLSSLFRMTTKAGTGSVLLVLLLLQGGGLQNLPVAVADGVTNQYPADAPYYLRWANTGNGWRSMSATFAYSALFAKMGLMQSETCNFTAISGNSGSTWSLSQLFFSKPMFDALVTPILKDSATAGTTVHDFLIKWMTAYRTIVPANVTFDSRCAPLEGALKVPGMEILVEYCSNFANTDRSIITDLSWDWAAVVQNMLSTTARAFNDTDNFGARQADIMNRLKAFQYTDLFFQSTIAANSKTSISSSGGNGNSSNSGGGNNSSSSGNGNANNSSNSGGGNNSSSSGNDNGNNSSNSGGGNNSSSSGNGNGNNGSNSGGGNNSSSSGNGNGNNGSNSGSDSNSSSTTNATAVRQLLEDQFKAGGADDYKRQLQTAQETMVYLASEFDSTRVYAMPLGLQFAIKTARFDYWYGTDDAILPITTLSSAPSTFNVSDWKSFYLFPGTKGKVFSDTLVSDLERNDGDTVSKDTVRVQPPFSLGEIAAAGDYPTFAQITGASSAFISLFSGATGSFLAQFISQYTYAIENATDMSEDKRAADLKTVNDIANALYTTSIMENMAVCSQWPKTCDDNPLSARYLDGSFSDPLSLAMNIGQYQTVDKGSMAVPLRFIVSDNNFYSDRPVGFLSYFNTSFNLNSQPGDFVWIPAVDANLYVNPTPFRSQRIFEETLTPEDFKERMDAIKDSNVTTGQFFGYTLENRAFSVKPGQEVYMFLIQLNTNLPTGIFTQNDVDLFSEKLATMAQKEIAENTILQQRIEAFLNATYFELVGRNPNGTKSPNYDPLGNKPNTTDDKPDNTDTSGSAAPMGYHWLVTFLLGCGTIMMAWLV